MSRTLSRAFVALLIIHALASCQFDGSGVSSNGGDEMPDSGLGDVGDYRPDAAVTVDAEPPSAPDGMTLAPIDSAPPPITLADAAPPPPPPPACPPDYAHDPGTQTAYRVSNMAKSWHAAEKDCENDGDGTHLAYITDPNELAHVQGLIVGAVWVGITDSVDEDVFLVVVGWLAGFTPWRPGEPNDFAPGEDCVSLNALGYNDESCAKQRRYVCECDGFEPDPDAYR